MVLLLQADGLSLINDHVLFLELVFMASAIMRNFGGV
jgi:hypothetical protein